jgi:hypothetical protein
MTRFSPRSVVPFCVSGLAALAVAALPAAAPAGADQPSSQPALTAFTILSGMTLSHTFTVSGTNTTASEPLTKPDDITKLGGLIVVGFQNGVGPQGEPSSDGNTDGTIVAIGRFGKALGQWDVQGKIDGLTADPAIGGLIATVNEDANSSLYTIAAGAHGVLNVQHYAYNEPLPHNGGTDAISVLGDQIFISASAPGTTGTLAAPQPTFPAVYSVTLDSATSVATVSPLFYDEDTATVANVGAQEGQKMALALTDPDSSEIVPKGAPRFARDFMLDSQGDQQQIFVEKGDPSKSLSVLTLSQAVDDTAWAVGPGVLYGTDSTNDAVDVLGGTFGANPIVAVTPCGANTAPSTCPSLPDFPPNYLGSLNPSTGAITPVPVSGAAFVPQGGLLFMPSPHER